MLHLRGNTGVKLHTAEPHDQPRRARNPRTVTRLQPRRDTSWRLLVTAMCDIRSLFTLCPTSSLIGCPEPFAHSLLSVHQDL